MPQRASSPLTDADYHAMEAAISETERGRAFLAEHGRRARANDKSPALSAREQIEAVLLQSPVLVAHQGVVAPLAKAALQDPWAAIKAMNEEEKISLFS